MVEPIVFHDHWRTMSDDQGGQAFEENRDIQKENAANNKVALHNQQEAMAI